MEGSTEHRQRGSDRKNWKANEFWILRGVKWDAGGGKRLKMGQKLTWCVGYSYPRKAISMWRGVCEQSYGRETRWQRGERKEKGEKCKIPAGTQSHQGGLPGGERIKKKVIDIHFNPQLTTCHPIFTPETQKRAMKYQADNGREQQGAEKERGKERKKGE